MRPPTILKTSLPRHVRLVLGHVPDERDMVVVAGDHERPELLAVACSIRSTCWRCESSLAAPGSWRITGSVH